MGAFISGSMKLNQLMSLQSVYLFYFWISRQNSLEEIKILAIWFCAGAGIGGLLGGFQVISGINYLPNEQNYLIPEKFKDWPPKAIRYLSLRNDRAVGTRSHPLTYAETLMPAIFCSLVFLLNSKNKFGRYLSLGCLLAVALGIILAQGRAVWLGVVCGVFVMGFLMGRKVFLKTATFSVLLMGLIAFALPNVRGRFISAVSTKAGSLGDQQSKSTRIELWKDGISKCKEKPWMGWGVKGFELKAIDPVEQKERVWTEAHNIYIQILLESGMAGLGLFLWFLIATGRFLVKLKGRFGSPMAGLFVSFLIAGLTESWLGDKEISMIFWLFIGVVSFLERNPIKTFTLINEEK
jgi:O-antigen ligase